MDIDTPSNSNLKRSNSAPIINDLSPNAVMNNTQLITLHTRDIQTFSFSSRTRRFSTSSSFSPHANSTSQVQRLTHRVDQLKQEDLCNREVTHEREIHSAMQISQSYEDLSLDTELLSCRDKSVNHSSGKAFSPLNMQPGSLMFTSCSNSNPSDSTKFPTSSKESTSPLFPTFGSSSSGPFKNHLLSSNSKMLPLNVQTNHIGGTTPMLCSSPSPTRGSNLPRQCFSPNFNWKCSSPSPTRKSFATRRSLSPIAMRPSSFTLKRKFDLDIGNDEGPNMKKTATQVFSQSGIFGCTRGTAPTSGLVLSHNSDSNDKKDVTMSYSIDSESDKKEYVNGEATGAGTISMVLDGEQNALKQDDMFNKDDNPVTFNKSSIQQNLTMLFSDNQNVEKPNVTENLQTSQFTFRPVSNDICDNEENMNTNNAVNEN
ncbi:protein FAM122B-like isoform X2 [Ctenocephalides felis]|uniref:protein FAM122B-like isoform X2 n=1 Tax=Ctenocephalides felis TaxID=7515 RepID=UPI000E6E47D1|nr:protein FAM122B-like isoform X2 [Ctenocephalides felis]XP_026473364.1 protein FAM122B-like isoform X2 [Ctenocephalides felis]